MSWWQWTLLWVVLVLAGAAVLALAARRLFRQGMALARELGVAADELAQVTRAVESLGADRDGPHGWDAPPAWDAPPTSASPGRVRP